jgi:hydroxymethylpyrimidine kinase/phosphomethylpyrimidine kinase/thiamine-phosphate diphosphorylase
MNKTRVDESMCQNALYLLTIAGHDPSGGAGIIADTRAAHLLNVETASVITALTSQTPCGVSEIHSCDVQVMKQQILSLQRDMPIGAIKIGMLATEAHLTAVAECVSAWGVPIVLDTPLIASKGCALLSASAIDLLRHRLMPLVTLITPNIPEAESLTGMRIQSHDDQLFAAQTLRDMGAKAVLLKGGHGEGDNAVDLLLTESETLWMVNERLPSAHSHGSGCVMSSLIAAGLLQQLPLSAAVVQAKALVHRGIALSRPIGQCVGAVVVDALAFSPQHYPRSYTALPASFVPAPAFPKMMRSMEIYPIVEHAADIAPLMSAGCRTVQLRMKNKTPDVLEAEIIHAIKIASEYRDQQLFINDYWQLAIKHGAFGVHLGQEDWYALREDDKQTLRDSGLRLGLSTHNFAELSIAFAANPSYLAIGPLFHTNSKVMPHIPVSIARLAVWKDCVMPTIPIVTIGGITLNHLPEIRATGVDGAAVMSGLYGQNAQEIYDKACRYLAVWRQTCA